mmetsp:Transcript_18368/g.57825  ORF Transcript_18368/g.57825 Transcript_18368/m.57825 type:complete len:355 (+) Transcript_18368:374-1438(+)|eukprot:CAMPEP_0197403330 /NCGR_PEP_ID=MMETSP1165-20131217/21384_1 /TAXON_ID=284809 /ORGANISM="Chrysocystis fragilis, Strain CCMP3189" /LENGTH=354 /DNA_ID=CAMNT_0042929537 /DNA_START=335 /DNA_END=1399 /DNA_ORIENTATION=-
MIDESESWAVGDSCKANRRARAWLESLVYGLAETASSLDEDAKAALELRCALRERGLPTAFGGRVEKKFPRPGDYAECYCSGDGLWYVARVLWRDDEEVGVEFYGYSARASVPATWLRRTKRAPSEAVNRSRGHDKYWAQRYLLFSKFDSGVLIPDPESWYSVTPEPIAADLARRCRGSFVVDAFCGCGGNAIQFALAGCTVLAIDLDPRKLAAARRNAELYRARVDFLCADALDVLPRLRAADVVFLSPPWGGPDYVDTFAAVADLELGRSNGLDLARLALRAAPNLVYFLPRTLAPDAARDFLAQLPAPRAELQSNYLNHALKAKTLFIGPLFLADRADTESPPPPLATSSS